MVLSSLPCSIPTLVANVTSYNCTFNAPAGARTVCAQCALIICVCVCVCSGYMQGSLYLNTGVLSYSLTLTFVSACPASNGEQVRA
jgi:hypothetical protein